MAMPEVKWKPLGLTKREHKDYQNQVSDTVEELDYVLNCYYLSMSDDISLSEDDKLQFMKHALEEALKKVGVTGKKVVFFDGT